MEGEGGLAGWGVASLKNYDYDLFTSVFHYFYFVTLSSSPSPRRGGLAGGRWRAGRGGLKETCREEGQPPLPSLTPLMDCPKRSALASSTSINIFLNFFQF